MTTFCIAFYESYLFTEIMKDPLRDLQDIVLCTWHGMQVRDSEFSAVRPEEAELVPRLLDRQWLEKGPTGIFFSLLVDIDF
jgi:hypothetical protein